MKAVDKEGRTRLRQSLCAAIRAGSNISCVFLVFNQVYLLQRSIMYVPAFQSCRLARGKPNAGFSRPSAAHALSFGSPLGRTVKEPSVEEIAEVLLDKECAIKDMFAPGKPMPRASEVNRMRKEAKELRQKLSEMMGEDPRLELSSSSSEVATVLSHIAAMRAQSSSRTLRDRISTPAMSYDASSGVLTDSELAILQELEAENSRLRARANALLSRQQFLESKMLENGLQLPDGIGGTIDVDNEVDMSRSMTKDPTYAMSAPSYY